MLENKGVLKCAENHSRKYTDAGKENRYRVTPHSEIL